MAVIDTGWGEAGGSHGSLRHWLWRGEAGLLMAVLDTCCGEGRCIGSHGSPRRWLWGRDGGSHGNPRRWLWVGEKQRSSFQSQTLVVDGG